MGLFDAFLGTPSVEPLAKANRNVRSATVLTASKNLATAKTYLKKARASSLAAIANAEGDVKKGYSDADKRILEGLEDSLEALGIGRDAAIELINSGKWDAIDALVDGGEAAISAVNQGYAQGYSALDTAQEYLTRGRAEFDQYAEAGDQAVKAIQDLQGFNGPEAQAEATALWEGSPEFRNMVIQQDRIFKDTTTSTNALGDLYSGATMKALQDRSTENASLHFNDYYGKLAGLMANGMSAAEARATLDRSMAEVEAERASMGAQQGRDVGNVLFETGSGVAGLHDTAAGRGAEVWNQYGTNAAEANMWGAGNRADIAIGKGNALGNLDLARGDVNSGFYGGMGQSIIDTRNKMLGANTNFFNNQGQMGYQQNVQDWQNMKGSLDSVSNILTGGINKAVGNFFK